jgi:glycosyltransferase involved in cell wall biosynthesis
VAEQTRPVAQISIAVDTLHEGAPATRNRAMLALETDWVGFLDDDDLLLPLHVEHLLDEAESAGDVGMVWGWFTVAGGVDPFPPDFRGRQYEAPDGHCVPITYLVRRDVLRAAWDRMGGFQADPDGTGNWGVQDLPIIDTIHAVMADNRMRSLALPTTTWVWNHHGSNTSGLGSRW